MLLAACDELPRTKTSERAELADVNARNALARNEDLNGELDDLRQEVDRLKSQLESNDSLDASRWAAAEEARGNHSRLQATFNDNVDKSNKRDAAQDADIDWLMRRNGVAR